MTPKPKDEPMTIDLISAKGLSDKNIMLLLIILNKML